MKHYAIMREIPRILQELRVPSLWRKPDEESGAEDMIYRLCCQEALEIMAERLGVTPASVYEAITQVFKTPLAELERRDREIRMRNTPAPVERWPEDGPDPE